VLVEERRWLGAEEFLDYWSICQPIPGGNIINLAIAFGARCAGPLGSVAAFAGLVCAPFPVLLVLGWLYTRFGHLPQVEPVFRGVSAAGAGLVIATAVQMALSPRMRSPLAVLGLAAFVLSAWLRWPLLAVLGLLLPLSLLAAWKGTR
jgi:chromate transporter